MEEIILINGSPRAPRSNSKRYAQCFQARIKLTTKYVNLTASNHQNIINELDKMTDVVFVFPLYVDAIPSSLLNFLKTLEEVKLKDKPTISVLINCGFIEYQQNDVAIEMIKLFCKQNAYEFGSVLSIGGGEAILDTPFKQLVHYKIGLFAKSIKQRKYKKYTVTMPMTKKMYIKASTNYWVKYGRKYKVTKEQMQTLTIEADLN